MTHTYISGQAILGAHGYKTHETYDPIWRHVHVPEQFLQLVCPMAEGIHAEIVGLDNLSGAANYWSMIMMLRPYFFQVSVSKFVYSCTCLIIFVCTVRCFIV